MVEGSSGSPYPHRRRIVASAIVLALIAVVGLVAWRTVRGNLPSDAEQVEYVVRLEATVLPVIEQQQVAYFMDERDCAILTYSRGDFIDGDPEDCGSTDDSHLFDDVAWDDHGRLAAALAESQTPIERTGGAFTGRDLRFAFFMSTQGAPFATSWQILYDPADSYPRRTTNLGAFTPIPDQEGWWFVCCAD